jgi:hypothetical protein
VKQALAVVASHYEINLKQMCEGYVLPNKHDLVEAEIQRLVDAIKGSGSTQARYFEGEVIPPVLSPAAAAPPCDSEGGALPPRAVT